MNTVYNIRFLYVYHFVYLSRKRFFFRFTTFFQSAEKQVLRNADLPEASDVESRHFVFYARRVQAPGEQVVRRQN